MDCKTIITEQIRDLQKVQDNIIKAPQGRESVACEIAKTIAELCEIIRRR